MEQNQAKVPYRGSGAQGLYEEQQDTESAASADQLCGATTEGTSSLSSHITTVDTSLPKLEFHIHENLLALPVYCPSFGRCSSLPACEHSTVSMISGSFGFKKMFQICDKSY